MSIAALTDEELIATESKFVSRAVESEVAKSSIKLQQILRIGRDRAPELEGELDHLAKLPPALKTRASSAIDALVRFIPTEAITLYVAAVAALSALADTYGWITETILYWIFVCLTPVLFLLVYMGKRKTAGLSVLPGLTRWPWFKLMASTIAFMVWALAIPTSPYLDSDDGKVVAAFGAVFVSTFLTLLEPVLSRKPAAS